MTTQYYKHTGIRQQVIDEIRALAEQYAIAAVVLFGSRARGDHTERSDIDLAVYGGRSSEFALAVDEETTTLLKYDIVDLDASVQPELRASIEKEGILIYEKIR